MVLTPQRTASVVTISSELGRIGLRKYVNRSSLYEEKPARQNIVEDTVHHIGSIDSDKDTFKVLLVRLEMKFPLGRIVWTRGVNDRIAIDTSISLFVLESLKRHANCDWGELSTEDKRENDLSLDRHLRLLSSYQQAAWKIWIISEADRSVTTILFPSEY